MALNPDSIIKAASELKEAQEHVKVLEGRLRAMLNEHPGVLIYSGMPPLKSVLVAGPATDRVISLLMQNPDKTFGFDDIYTEIKGNAPSLRSLLAKLVKDGRIASRGWGKYGALAEQKEKPKAV